MVVRFSIASLHSRLRIKLLESEDAASTKRLVHIFEQPECQAEHIRVIADIGEGPIPTPSLESKPISKKIPRITQSQRKMVAALNSLPQLKKERAYLPDLRNSHAAIIMRNGESHKIGEGVLRHWADAFVM